MKIHQTKNVRSRLRNLIHTKSNMHSISNGRFTISEFEVTNVECLGISKLGNVSWKGMIKKDKVKIVETESNDHAKAIYEIMCLPDLKEFFPQLVFRVDKYIVLEWVDGVSLDKIFVYKAKKYIEDIFWFQYTLHNSLCKVESSYRYNYFDYLSKRYSKYAGPFYENSISHGLPDFNISNIQQRFFHLDITPRNVIVVGNTLKIIDNELLGFGIYYPFDFLNTYEAIKNHRSSIYYLRLIERNSAQYLDWINNSKDIILYYWRRRLSGSYMQSLKLMPPIIDDTVPLATHPIIELLERNKKNEW